MPVRDRPKHGRPRRLETFGAPGCGPLLFGDAGGRRRSSQVPERPLQPARDPESAAHLGSAFRPFPPDRARHAAREDQRDARRKDGVHRYGRELAHDRPHLVVTLFAGEPPEGRQPLGERAREAGSEAGADGVELPVVVYGGREDQAVHERGGKHHAGIAWARAVGSPLGLTPQRHGPPPPSDATEGSGAILAFVLRTRSLVVLSSLASILTIGASASAQDGGLGSCEAPVAREPMEVTPADNARQVSLDAPVRVQYTPGYFGPEGPGDDPTRLIQVFRCPELGCGIGCRIDDASSGEFVPGRVQVLGDNLFFFPDADWEPNQAYAGLAKGRDSNLAFSFCTGSTTDNTPPELRGLENVTSTPASPRCDAPEGGYRIAAFFAPADDAGGPPASIEYLLFQTRGAGIEEPVLRSTIRNFATETHTMAFVLPPGQAGEPICVRVAAVDGNGNIDWSDENPEVDCVDPVQGNYFASICSVAAVGAGRAPLTGIGVAAAALLTLVIRRRR